MNFLAHLVLAPQSPHGLVGSIAPDLIRGPLPKDLHPQVLVAAREHHRVDRFTDAHPAFARTRVNLRDCTDPRLTGVLADVLYDHILARDWTDWRSDTLSTFIQQAEHNLLHHTQLMPADMQQIVRLMIDEQWLASYASVQGLRDRLAAMSRRITRRLGRPFDLALTEQQLESIREAITQDFAALWPDLKTNVTQHRLRIEKERLIP